MDWERCPLFSGGSVDCQSDRRRICAVCVGNGSCSRAGGARSFRVGRNGNRRIAVSGFFGGAASYCRCGFGFNGGNVVSGTSFFDPSGCAGMDNRGTHFGSEWHLCDPIAGSAGTGNPLRGCFGAGGDFCVGIPCRLGACCGKGNSRWMAVSGGGVGFCNGGTGDCRFFFGTLFAELFAALRDIWQGRSCGRFCGFGDGSCQRPLPWNRKWDFYGRDGAGRVLCGQQTKLPQKRGSGGGSVGDDGGFTAVRRPGCASVSDGNGFGDRPVSAAAGKGVWRKTN